MGHYITKTAEDALSNAFQAGYESANEGSKNVSWHFIESVLTEMAHDGSSGDSFERSIERRTQ